MDRYIGNAAFLENDAVTASVLNAVNAGTAISFSSAAGGIYGGNSVDFGAIALSRAITAINQNTGAGANTQQTVTLDITLTAP